MPLQQIRSSTANKRPVATNLADGQLSVNYHVDSPGVFFKDTNNTLVKVGPIHVGTTAPNVSPAGAAGNSRGEAWLDTSTTNPTLKVWNGSAWAAISSVTTGTPISTTDTGTVTSTMIANGTIVDADLNASAAIAHSKLASLTAGNVLLGNVSNVPTSTAVTGDVTITSAGVTAIAAGVVVNADINASAAIAHSKLANITAGQVLLGNVSNVPTATALSGDVTVNSSGVTAIGSGVIVNADISATAEIAVNKLANGTARQLLQTAANGTDVEWTPNLDVPGTLDVTGATTFDSDVTCASTGALTLPDGTTAQRPGSPSAGMIRLNTSTGQFEGYSGSAWEPFSYINSGPLAGFRNAIINGKFDHWVRGTTFTGVEYGPDRWYLARTGTTRTASRQSFTLGQTDVPGEPRFFLRQIVTSVANVANFAVSTQRIEDVRTYAGQLVTLSFYAKADAAKPISIEMVQNFGTGGSPSAEVTGLGVTKVTLSTIWQKFTVTTTLPSISGKVLGSDNNSYLAVGIWMDAGSNFSARTSSLGQQSGTFDLAQFQLEPGPVTTPFENRALAAELAMCQRYYQVGTAVNWSYSSTNGAVGNSFEFATPMRAAPTVALSGGSSTNVTSVGVIEVFPDGSGFSARGVTTATGQTYWQRNYTAESEL
jgi:hypothetical protein